MGLDIRLPIGLMFTIMGVLLAGYGAVGDKAIYARSLGLNVNLWWGVVCLVFGLIMLALAFTVVAEIAVHTHKAALMNLLSFYFAHPFVAVAGSVLLLYCPPLLDILPMYVTFLFFTPIVLTAAVRDLHRCYPGRFQTDVRTLWPDLWAHNPYLTPLAEEDKDVRQLECSYPLINECNETPYHCLHGFIQFLNQKLGLHIRPTAFKGDIHLTALEKSWYSQVYELTGRDIPFWILSGGGKYDVTVKWWDPSRYRAVVDHFRGKVQFVQIGHSNHHHPKLEGTIDLRGRTSLRELVRLVYHSDGVLCPVTAVMHLAAAVERKTGGAGNRPCVVVAGGREPAHWEAYPGHQFLHTNDALRCCAGEGCWRDRTIPLRDGDLRDRMNCLCVDVVGELPRCMNMIRATDVIRCIWHGLGTTAADSGYKDKVYLRRQA